MSTAVDDHAPATVEVHDVHKWYGTHRVLNGVDLTVRPGEVTVILGPSGSGKSTLLRVINHLEKPEIGYVSLNGEPIGVRRHGTRLKELGERAILATGELATFRACYGRREIAEDGTIAIDARAARALGVGKGDEVWSAPG